MPVMREQIDQVENDFWTYHLPLFTAHFPTYYTKPQTVWGRFHTSEERYFGTASEIIPLIPFDISCFTMVDL
jgi:hypothetical protein